MKYRERKLMRPKEVSSFALAPFRFCRKEFIRLLCKRILIFMLNWKLEIKRTFRSKELSSELSLKLFQFYVLPFSERAV